MDRVRCVFGSVLASGDTGRDGLRCCDRGACCMRLSRLTLSGFKSFADTTVLTFDDPMTGVVGPNGCGKSNVVDAIKWVLGERSSKSLRGKEMIDVIFAGSARRAPAGMASVSLTFENPVINENGEMDEIDVGGAAARAEGEIDTDDHDEGSVAPTQPRDRAKLRRGLPIDTDEIVVERRLYRDGTSQYLVNAKRARLRDIRELFLDTGIGADAYSIIEQGKVDAMLLASPQERRTIFEEAAGIARFKQRRIESLRKLDKAERNLLLTREQLQNNERRLRMVKGQAAKARRYQELHTEYLALRAAVVLAEYHEMLGRLERACLDASRSESLAAEARTTFDKAEAERNDAELARHDAQHSLQQAERDAQHEASRKEAALQQRAMLDTSLHDATARVRDLESVHEHASERRAEIEAEQLHNAEALRTLDAKLSESHQRLETAQTDRAGAMESLAAQRSAADRFRISVNDIERQLAAAAATSESDRLRIAQIVDQAHRLGERAETLASEAAELDRHYEQQTHLVSDIARQVLSVQAENTKHADQLAAISADRRQLAEAASGLEHERLRLDTRIATLEEMVRDRVGLGSAVRDMLDQKQAGLGFHSVLCPLADVIEASSDDAHVVEVALGDALRAVLVPTVPQLPDESYLSSLAERVTFLSLAPLRSTAFQPPNNVVTSFQPHPVVVRSLVRSNIRHNTDIPALTGNAIDMLLDILLDQTYLVESLDAALMLRASFPAGARFITRTGTLLDRDGRVLAGQSVTSEGDSVGLLQRRAELAELETEFASLCERLATAKAQLEHVDSEAAAHNAQRSNLQSLLEEKRRAEIAGMSRLEKLESDRARVKAQLAELREEHADLVERRDSLERDQRSATETVLRLTELSHVQRNELTDAESRVAQAQSLAEQAAEQLAASRVETGTLTEQLAATKREARSIESALEQIIREILSGASRLDQTHSQINLIADQIRQSAQDATDADAKNTTLQQVIAERRNNLHRAIQRTSQANAHLVDLRDTQEQLDERWRNDELMRRELDVKVGSLEERALSSGDEFDLLREYVDYLLLIDDDSVVQAEPAMDTPHVDSLRRKIRDLGPVHLGAIVEETQLETRNEELVAQIADLDDARSKLISLIDQLNDASRTRFAESLDMIREHFASHDGMFRKLFGGGRAEIRLMPLVRDIDGQKIVTDETDLLESGIEIIAKPPGKEPRALSQLSGGEKTLTAVALLLAIFQSKPSCFCVLDEVDAALDEANVSRFVGVIREFTTHSHFIVITHNKKTMRAADRLFGITMQERGVSTTVPVRFEQYDAERAMQDEKNVPPLQHPDESPASNRAGPVAQTKATPDVRDHRSVGKPSLRSALAEMRVQANNAAQVAEMPSIIE